MFFPLHAGQVILLVAAKLCSGFCPHLARNITSSIGWLLVATDKAYLFKPKNWTSEKLSCWCVFNVHSQIPHLFNREKESVLGPLSQDIYCGCNPTSRVFRILQVYDQLLLDMWRLTICKWKSIVTCFLGELDQVRVSMIHTCLYQTDQLQNLEPIALVHPESRINKGWDFVGHIHIVSEQGVLYITFIIQKCMSVVSDFICLLDRSVVSDAGLARLRSVVSDTQRTVVSFFGKMPFVMHRKRLREFSGWNCKILWHKNQNQPKLMQNEIGIADEKAKTMQRHFQQENNTLHYANDWKICGDSIALLASPYVPTVMYKIVPRLMLVIPLLKINPASVIGVPIIIFRPCILPQRQWLP